MLLYANKSLFSNIGMSSFAGISDELYLGRISNAIIELAKGMKSVNFYPPNHPILIQAITKISLLFEDIPLPKQGLEITVTKNHLMYNNVPLSGSGSNKSLIDLNRELYIRRAARVIFLPSMMPDEIVSFLKAISRDVAQVLDDGGLEKVLRKEKVSRICINRVEYDKFTDALKDEEEEEEELELEEIEPEELDEQLFQKSIELELQSDMQEEKDDSPTVDLLLSRIEKETDPSKYRIHIDAFSRFLSKEMPAQKIEYSTRAISIFIRHIESPPGKSLEIADQASMGIQELISDELIDHYITHLKKGGIRWRQETETILVAMGEKAVNPLLQALAEEKDILIRKTIVAIVVRIGRAAVPAVLANLNDTRWYIIRNMVTILGSFDMPDLAPQIISTLSHPDLRVKREAIKALSRISLPYATTTLCELCFHPEESVALTATAALSSKKEFEAVEALFRRATAKKFIYPNYRLAHEAIDSLRAIGTTEAVIALEQILALDTLWKTEKFHTMKTHTLKSLFSIKGSDAIEAFHGILQGNDKTLRREAERILKRKTMEME